MKNCISLKNNHLVGGNLINNLLFLKQYKKELMKATFLIAGTAILLAIGTTFLGTNDMCCEGSDGCASTCCVEKVVS
jgi:hypothetical protein